MEYKLDAMYGLQNEVAVITGGSGSIGAESGLALASLGARVVLLGRNEGKLHTIQKDYQAKGLAVDIAALDLLDKDSVQGTMQNVADR
jgi:NADP-dependent 3-hydroxy acid dehydrogenase YdfG